MSVQLRRNADFNADRVNFAGFGYTGTATAGTTTNLDYLLSEERLVYGGEMILKDHAFGDKVAMQVVDVDNILGYGAGTVLGSYMSNWFVSSDKQTQTQIILDYPTKISAGLYLRVAYTSVGGTNVTASINIHCVKNIT